MTTHEVEMLLGITKQALIYYEKEGFILPKRNQNNYRDYDENDIDILKFVLMLRSMDISIDEIKLIMNNQLTIKQVLQTKQEFIKKNKIELDNIDKKVKDFIKRKKVKAVFSFKEYELFFDKDSIVYNNISIPIKNIKYIDLSLCNEIATFLGSLYVATKFNYYIDIDIEDDKNIYSYQILCNDDIYKMIQYLKDKHIKYNDPIGIVNLLDHYQTITALYQYLDRHYRSLAKKYQLDNPRLKYSFKERYTSDIQQQFIHIIDRIFK